MSSDPTALLAQLQAFNISTPNNLDPLVRKQLQSAAERLAHELDEPATAVFRLTVGQATQPMIFKIALDIGLFPLMAHDGTPKPLSVLAEGTTTDPVLLLRLLRYLATFGVVREHEDGTYTLAPSCSALGDETYAKAIDTVVELTRPLMQALPAVIKDNGRRNPEDRMDGAAQRAFNAPGRELFDMIKDMGPQAVQAFAIFLSTGSKDSAKMDEVYPVQERLIEGTDHGEVFWVDVGGGLGQRTIELKQKFPELPGRCVVQDMPPVVAQAKMRELDKLVDMEGHDFFQEQPIKGARTYYFRQCFHNWQDQNCKVMLERIAEGMKPGYSRLLIHDIVMPDRNAGVWEVMMDVLMMAGYSTLERNEAQWQALVQSAGLKIHKIYSKPTSAESIIEIIKE